jgi:hypothetical protein
MMRPFDFLDPVGALQVDQIVAEARQGFRVAKVPAAGEILPDEILPDEIKHGGEGAEQVIFLDVKL